MKNQELQDCLAMINRIYVNKDRSDFIYVYTTNPHTTQFPTVKMEAFQNRELSDFMWNTMLQNQRAWEEINGPTEPMTIPEIIDVLEDIGIEIIEE